MTDNNEIKKLLADIDQINNQNEASKKSNNKDNVENINENEQIGNVYLGTEISEEHKIVSQLDEVTKESEEKATELFDIMNDLSSDVMWILEKTENITKNINMIKEKNNDEINPYILDIEEDISEMDSLLNHANNIVFAGMSLMQYQDINRQKIERVVNVLRSLIKYLNLLFEGKTADNERTSSAAHLVGDDTTNLMENNEDLEDLINKFK